MKGLGQRLKALRKSRKMTQQDVADRLKMHRTTYTKYETERAEPPLDVICALSEMFSVTVDELLKRPKAVDDSDKADASKPTSAQASKTALRVRSPIATGRRVIVRVAGRRRQRCARRLSGW